jgi:large subunit ribosomal protein L29
VKSQDLQAMTDAELAKKLDDLFQEQFNLRFQRVAGQMPDTNRLKQVRRDIARVKTIARQREIAVARSGGGPS